MLKPGDRIFIFTDGITETASDANELYGFDRLKKKILTSNLLSPQDLADDIILDVKNFANNKDATDDNSLLILDYK